METLLKTPEDKEQFLLWIDFLKAGVFEKGTRKLQDGDTYCCLGVGCAVLIPEENLRFAFAVSTTELAGGLVSDQLNAPDWLKNINGHFKILSGESLVTLNDRGGLGFGGPWTHPEIADTLMEVYADELAAIK